MPERTKTQLRHLLRDPAPTPREDAMPTTVSITPEADAVLGVGSEDERIRRALSEQDAEAELTDAAMKEDTARILEILDRPTGDVLAIDQRARLVILGEVLDRAPDATMPELLALARWVEIGEMATAGEGR